MAEWRRRALALFPEWKSRFHEIGQTPYSLFFELLPATFDAHRRSDDHFLRRAYGYAEYCALSAAEDLWNSAGVAFYEHLVQERDLWESVVPWICPDVKKDVESLWDLFLSEDELKEFLFLYARHGGRQARETVYHTGEIFKF